MPVSISRTSTVIIVMVTLLLAVFAVSRSGTHHEGTDMPSGTAVRFDPKAFAARVLGRSVSEVESLWDTEEGAQQLAAELPISDFHNMGGPLDVVLRELRLTIARQHVELGNSVPVDYVIWQRMPHAEAFRTKLGGVPWRPKSRPWPAPHPQYGEYVFVMQLDISESHDVLPKSFLDHRPDGAEVLLFFFCHDEAWAIDNGIHYEWSAHDIADPCQAEDLPNQKFHVVPRAGLLFRGVEYPANVEHSLHPPEIPAGVLVWNSVTDATKIGTVTNWIQDDPHKSLHWQEAELIATLHSFYPPESWPYPDEEVRTAASPSYANCFDGEGILFGDDGTINFLMQPDGRIEYYSECY